MSKQRATFAEVRGWMDMAGTGVCAILTYPKDHPKLGSYLPWLRTSLVTGIKYSEDNKVIEVETLNTVYTLREGEAV